MRLDDRTQSASDFAQAAANAGVTISDDLTMDHIRAAASLFATVWRTGDDHPVTADLMRALSYEGNYVAGAFRDLRLVGASVGFLYASDDALGLHSHITGLLPDDQGRGAGFALKMHQRDWALRRGIQTARWTFDPLVRRNAYFNIAKLGAEVTELLPHFYGAMSDGINAGDESDRCLVTWRLTSERRPTQDAVDGSLILDEDVAGRPVAGPQQGSVRLCRVPEDIVAMRESAPDVALDWRRALRDVLGTALADGLRAAGFTRDGCYVLT